MRPEDIVIETSPGLDDFLKAVDLAIGLGGWKVDPADPWKQPYSPENAALAAIERYNVPRDYLPGLVEMVRTNRDNDPRRPEDYR